VNILFFLIKDGQEIQRWLSGHLGVPRDIGEGTLAYSVRSIRGYFVGTTLVGIVNALVVGIGAVALGTPLAAVLAVVMLFTNYIPFIGAFIGGAFAVLIAFAGGGGSDALVMLILVLVANGPGQWVVQPLALGASLKLHPIVILFATMAGTILAGPVGGVVAAPLAAVAVEAVNQIHAAGLFADDAGRTGEPAPDGGSP
jgi:predicted PurR-regulated permease PerM